MQHRIERSPGLEPDQAGHIRAEDRGSRGGEHQEHGEREGADIEALEYDAQQRHPGLGLAADGPVGGDGLGLGPRFGVGAERGGVAGFRRPLLAGVVDGVQHHLLAHDLARAACGADQELVRGGQRGHQLGPGQRVGGGVGEEPSPEYRPRAGDLGAPLRVEPGRAVLAGDDRAIDRGGAGAGRRLARCELEHARGRGAGGGRAGRGHQTPDVGALAEIVGGDMAEQQGVEDALPGIGAEVPREHCVGDLEAGGGGRRAGRRRSGRGAG